MRHGETMFNVQHKIQGWCDSPLTENGIAQAKKAGQYFKDHGITFDHAYSSTSERCCDTLELVTDMPYVRTKGLKENFYGELEGAKHEGTQKAAKEEHSETIPEGNLQAPLDEGVDHKAYTAEKRAPEGRF